MVLLIAVMVLAIAPRLVGVGWDLPRVYHPDEPFYVGKVLTMMQTGDLNPHWFQYPSLFLYLLLPAAVLVFLHGVSSGMFVQVSDMTSARMVTLGTGTTRIPSLYLLGRLEMTVCGLITVYLIYRLGRETFGRRTGTVAALLLALSPTHVLASHYYRPDALVTLLATGTVYAAVRVYRRGHWGDYLVTGLLAGLTAAGKYNGGIVLVTLWCVHLLRRGELTDVRLWLGTGAVVVSFLLGIPFALFDMPAWLDGMAWEVRHYYVAGHPGAEGGIGVLWYSGKLLTTMGLVPLFALMGFAAGMVRNRWSTVLTCAFPIAYFAVIASARVHTTIALTPLLPLLALLAARGFVALGEWRVVRGSVSMRRWLFAVALLALLAAPTFQTVRTACQFARPEVRTMAEQWMVEHLPAGARIAAESYSPLFTDHFDVTYVGRLNEYPPEWYVENQFDYLVASSAMYGRFYFDTSRYQDQVLAYEQVFASFTPLVKVQGPFKFLAEPDGDIRCYQIRQPGSE